MPVTQITVLVFNLRSTGIISQKWQSLHSTPVDVSKYPFSTRIQLLLMSKSPLSTRVQLLLKSKCPLSTHVQLLVKSKSPLSTRVQLLLKSKCPLSTRVQLYLRIQLAFNCWTRIERVLTAYFNSWNSTIPTESVELQLKLSWVSTEFQLCIFVWGRWLLN